MSRYPFLGAAQRFAVALCATASMGLTTQAAELWYDGFSLTDAAGDYVVDTALSGQTGGAGSFFTGTWIDANAGDAASFVHALSPGLTRPGFAATTVGGSAGRDAQFDCCVFTRTSKLFASPWGGFTDPDGTYYFGFLADFGTGNAADPHHRTIEMHDGGFDDSLNRNLMLGISNFAGLGNELALNVRDSVSNTSTNTVLSEAADLTDLSLQGTHYLVLKFEMSTAVNDVISVFLDPVGTTEPAPSASVSVGQFLADRMSTNAQFTFNTGSATAGGGFDELRVGTEFADVAFNRLAYVGIPEPSTTALAACAVAAMLRRSRR
jgi:hypothetical protein